MGNFRGPAGWLSWSRRSAAESDDLSLIPGTVLSVLSLTPAGEDPELAAA